MVLQVPGLAAIAGGVDPGAMSAIAPLGAFTQFWASWIGGVDFVGFIGVV